MDWDSFVKDRMFSEDFPQFQSLLTLRTVYTIHNLALQGVRPFSGHWSSFSAWFPEVEVDRRVLQDRRWPDCVNPTAFAIRLQLMIL